MEFGPNLSPIDTIPDPYGDLTVSQPTNISEDFTIGFEETGLTALYTQRPS